MQATRPALLVAIVRVLGAAAEQDRHGVDREVSDAAPLESCPLPERADRGSLAATRPRLASVHAVMPGTEKRRAARRSPEPGEPLRRVRSRTGHELDVVDVSPTGLLIEGRARLLPNTHLDLHLVTRTGRVLVRCRVIRAYVWYLEADLVRYRVALAFDQSVDTSGGSPKPAPFADLMPAASSA